MFHYICCCIPHWYFHYDPDIYYGGTGFFYFFAILDLKEMFKFVPKISSHIWVKRNMRKFKIRFLILRILECSDWLNKIFFDVCWSIFLFHLFGLAMTEIRFQILTWELFILFELSPPFHEISCHSFFSSSGFYNFVFFSCILMSFGSFCNHVKFSLTYNLGSFLNNIFCKHLFLLSFSAFMSLSFILPEGCKEVNKSCRNLSLRTFYEHILSSG